MFDNHYLEVLIAASLTAGKWPVQVGVAVEMLINQNMVRKLLSIVNDQSFSGSVKEARTEPFGHTHSGISFYGLPSTSLQIAQGFIAGATTCRLLAMP